MVLLVNSSSTDHVPLHLSYNDRWCSDSFGLWLKCNQPNGASSNMHHCVHLDEIAVTSNIFCAAI